MEVVVVSAQSKAHRVSAATVVMAVLGWMGSQALPVRTELFLDGTALMGALAPMEELAAMLVWVVWVRSWARMVCPAWVAPVVKAESAVLATHP